MGWYEASDGQWYESADPPQPGWWLASDDRWYAPEQAPPKKKSSTGEVVLALSVAGTVLIAVLLGVGLIIGPQDEKIEASPASKSEQLSSKPAPKATAQSSTTAPTTTAASTTTEARAAMPPSTTEAPTTTRAPTTTSTPATTAPAPVSAAVECQSRPAPNGEILARSITTDEPPWVDPLGGGWVWSFGDKECITSIEFILRANPPLEGFCTEVALVADNPGYDPDQRPAPPLRNVIAVAGDC